jgi:two-component system, chemotaxis family, CheB/CheR fusion protein
MLVDEKLHHSQEHLADFFENAPVGLHWAAPDGTILRANRTELELLGYEEEEYIGHHIAEFHVDEQVIADMLDRLAAGETLKNYEARLKCKDGTIKYALINANVYREEGKFIHTRCFTRDITEMKQTQRAITESEHRYKMVLEASNDGLYDWDVKNNTVYWNDTYYDILGLEDSKPEPTFEFFSSLIHPDDRDRVVQEIQESLSSPDYHVMEYRVRYDNGTYRYLLCRGRTFMDSDGRPTHLSGLVRDITEQKLAELSMKESEERFRTMADAAHTLIWMTDEQHNLVYLNKSFLEYVGLTDEDAQLTPWQLYPPPEELPLIQQAMTDSAETKIPFRMEHRLKRPDGSWGWLIATGAPRYDADGNFKGFIGANIDITDEKNIQAALQESEQRFRAMADAAPVFIWMSGLDMLCTYFNKSWLEFRGCRLEQELGYGWVKGIHPEDTERSVEIYKTSFAARREFKLENRLQRYDGEYRWLLVNGIPRFTPKGVFAGYIGSCVDITDMKLAMEQAEEANLRKSQFLATMSHELRTPLNAIIGYGEMLEGGFAGSLNDKQQKYANNISRSGRHLLELVNEVLDLAKVESGKMVLSPQWVDLAAFLKGKQALVSQLAQNKKVSMHFERQPQLVQVQADLLRLRQIFLNLFSNAIKYNKEGGSVYVRLYFSEDEQHWLCEIEDTGIGIEKDKQSQIFTEFYQVDNTYSRKFEGTGLGLSVTQKLIELHGGKIWVESEPGVGSKFTFQFPVEISGSVITKKSTLV